MHSYSHLVWRGTSVIRSDFWHPWLKLHFLRRCLWVGGSEKAHWKSFVCTVDLGPFSCPIHIHLIWCTTPCSVFCSLIRVSSLSHACCALYIAKSHPAIPALSGNCWEDLTPVFMWICNNVLVNFWSFYTQNGIPIDQAGSLKLHIFLIQKRVTAAKTFLEIHRCIAKSTAFVSKL